MPVLTIYLDFFYLFVLAEDFFKRMCMIQVLGHLKPKKSHLKTFYLKFSDQSRQDLQLSIPCILEVIRIAVKWQVPQENTQGSPELCP